MLKESKNKWLNMVNDALLATAVSGITSDIADSNSGWVIIRMGVNIRLEGVRNSMKTRGSMNRNIYGNQ